MMNNLAYRMPAEWERQQAIILSWPHNRETWPYQLEQVILTYVQLIREISESQEVWLNVNSVQDEIEVKRILTLHGSLNSNVKIFQIPTHDAWVRDYGPIYLVNGSKRIISNWLFNGWGDKYDDGYFNDSKVPSLLASETKDKICNIDFVLEGGSIDVNGQGTLLTSKDCLLNANRNQTFTQNQIELVLKDNLGIKKVIWVEGEIIGDDTDGHIDDAARFVDNNTVVCICEDNTNDENYLATQSIYKQLCFSTDQDGRPLRVVKLPMPDPVYYSKTRLPASYANFLIANDKVLVPTYRCSNDSVAIGILSDLFAGRKVVGIDSTDLVYGLGSFHCISMQVPAG